MERTSKIKTPDQRLRVFVSSTVRELADERRAATDAIRDLRLSPILFESGARPHAPKEVYRSYLAQSHIFVGIYWESYGWIAPGAEISGIEEELTLAAELPKLIYIKRPAPARDPRLEQMLERFRSGSSVSYRTFETPQELGELVKDDLVVMLSERFEEGNVPETTATSTGLDHLPSFVNLFIGRDREMNEVADMLQRDDVRLVTLTGPGGIGKSRLALEVGAALKDRFEGGVHLVALESITDPALVLPAIASTLQVADSLNMFGDTLIQFLRDKRLLLILDNLEQVLGITPDLVRLLEECPGVKMLVTSRAVLNVTGEHEVSIPVLGLPRNGARDVETLGRSEAVQLFVARVRATDPAFELTAENAGTIAEICRRLDGLPLALELAAARSRLFTPQALLGRLDRRFSILTGGASDLPLRHRALRSTIAWSFELLEPSERELFVRLAVFRGGWSLEAAEAVCGSLDGCDVLNDSQALLDSSLIRVEEGESEPRFSMLETVREFASELLERSEAATAMSEAHAGYFFELAREAGERLRTVDQAEWLRRLEADHENVREAFGWALSHDRPGAAAQAGWSLWMFWWIRSHLDEGLRWMSATLEQRDGLSREERARASAVAGVMHFWQANFGEAIPLIVPVLEEFRALDDKTGIALCQLALGFMEASVSEPSTALARFDEARVLFEERDDLWGRLLSLNAICWLALSLDLEEVPEERFEQAVGLADRLRIDADRAMAVGNLGRRHLYRGELESAEGLMLEALRIFAANSILSSASYILDALAELAVIREENERAALLFGTGEALRRASRFPLLPFLQVRWDEWTARLKQRIGDAGFSAGFSKGLAMTLEEAVAYVDPIRAES